MLADITSDYACPPPERLAMQKETTKTTHKKAKLVKMDQAQQDSWFDRARLRIHCSFFCGGSQCKHENWEVLSSTEKKSMAIEGLNSNWVKTNIVASQRPSTSLFLKYPLIAEFKKKGITGVFNLQEKGEHANCGPDGVYESSGYSYNGPEDLMPHGISYYEFPWPDMTAPQQDIVLRSVQVMDYHVKSGGKALVHCHAGLGRTGLMIACYYVYMRMPSKEAIELVRTTRPGAIQTASQAQFIGDFERHLWRLTQAFRVEISDALIDLNLFLQRQYTFLHGKRAYLYKYIPLFLHSLLCRLLNLAAEDPDNYERALLSMSPSSSPEIVTLQTCRVAINYRFFPYEKIDDISVITFLVFDWFRSLSSPVLSSSDCDNIVVLMREGAFNVDFIRRTLSKDVRHTVGMVTSCIHLLSKEVNKPSLTLYSFRTMVNAFNHAYNPIKVRHSPIERELVVRFFMEWGASVEGLYFSEEGTKVEGHETISNIAMASCIMLRGTKTVEEEEELMEKNGDNEPLDGGQQLVTVESTEMGSQPSLTISTSTVSPRRNRRHQSVLEVLNPTIRMDGPQPSAAFYPPESDDDTGFTDPI